MSSDIDVERRKYELECFLQSLISSKELRNSRELINFLGLHTFCPEFLVNCPQLLFKQKEDSGFCVSQFKFLPKSNIFVTAANCKKRGKSIVKFYSFKESSLVQDSYRLLAGKLQKENPVEGRRQSFQNQFLQSDTSPVDQYCMERLPIQEKCQVDLLFEYQFDNHLIHSLDYHEEYEMLSFGTSRG